MKFDISFFKNRRVLITGHTGFKGSWMCRVLILAGAKVTGVSLEPPTEPSLFKLCNISKEMCSIIEDVRNLNALQKIFSEIQPEIVIHMAAQPLVRESYEKPVYTYDVNVMGTVNVLECVRHCPSVKSVVNVTTDKVYLNKEWVWGYREDDELNGYDPYSNSKSCSELVTSSFIKSFFHDRDIAVSTCGAGNVIGGGDFAKDRIIPDCIRAAISGDDIIVRNPYSTRPYQHVLEPVIAYLMLAQRQYFDKSLAGNYNIGPDEVDCWSTENLVDQVCKEWKKQTGKTVIWQNRHEGGPHEAKFLKLDCSKVKNILGWQPSWHIEYTIKNVVEWFVAYKNKESILEIMDKQIGDFIELVQEH